LEASSSRCIYLYSKWHLQWVNPDVPLKQCCYSLLKENDTLTDCPPPIFIESKIEIYFSKVAQLSAYPFDIINLLEQFKGVPILFIFYETKCPEITPDEHNLPKISSSISKNIILYFPFESLEGMKKALSVRQEGHRAGFKALFFSPDQLESICEDTLYA
jgi:hypothetical protein